ncbi:B12-binding domain-containing radical SAM protein [Pseudothermotoga sp.]
MRRPRDTRDLKEQNLVARLKAGEKYVEKIETKGDLMVALVYPNTYELAASNLGFNLVWKYLNQLERVRCERFFFDESFERFYSIDSLTPIDQFAIWAFSFHFENDIVNVMKLLLRKSVPLRNIDRSQSHPIILFGGALCYTELPLLNVLADVILHGDIESMLTQLDRVLRPAIRSELLQSFIDLPFATVPLHEKKFQTVSQCRDLDSFVPASVLVPERGEFAHKLLVEIERGCIHRCAYCMMGKLKKPARFLSLQKLPQILQRHDSVGLIASNVTDYPWLDELVDVLEESGISVSVSSLRIDRLNERFLKFLKKHQNSFTVALESASERLRNILKKDLTDAQVERAFELARKMGFEEVKVYFMFGFEEESEQDLMAIGDMAKHLLELGFKTVKLSINPFIPKRGTEFEKRTMQDEKILRQKMKIISSSLPARVKVDFESLRHSRIQFFINSMDEDLAEELLLKVQKCESPERVINDVARAV